MFYRERNHPEMSARRKPRILNRLITIDSQDPLPQNKKVRAKAQKNSFFRLFGKNAYLALVFSFFVVPGLINTNSAGATSGGTFLSSPEAGRYNSQTLELLSPRTGPDIKGPVGGSEDPLIDDNALVASASPTTDADEEKIISASGNDISIYTVREGDTLSAIAEMFDISPNTIRWANDIDVKGTIRPGQELIILPIAGVKHTVKKGETIEQIAKSFGGDAREIKIFNGIEDGQTLAVGTEIIIPNGEIAEAPKTSSSSKSTSSKSKGAPSKEVAGGYYVRPVKGIKTQGSHGQYGAIDVGAKIGTPVWAMADGIVMIAKGNGAWNGGYGNYIVIGHANGTQTLYAHLSRVDVHQGQKVGQGAVIGAVGSTGHSTGPHLHFEIRGAASTAARMY